MITGITEIKYGRTINTGDYNNEKIEATYVVAEGECPQGAMVKLKNFVNTGEYLSEPKVAKTTTETKVDEDMVVTETPKKTEEEKKPAQKATKKAAKKVTKKATGRKALTPKPDVVYTRESKAHKDEMAGILSEEFPNWKTEEGMPAKAKALSTRLEGTPIYNHKGVLLDGFREAIIEGMTADSNDL